MPTTGFCWAFWSFLLGAGSDGLSLLKRLRSLVRWRALPCADRAQHAERRVEERGRPSGRG